MHIYVFGSLCRGEIRPDSDVDLLAIIDGVDKRFDPSRFSIYGYSRILDLWHSGNAFAWHLHLESKLIFSDDSTDYLAELGRPKPYRSAAPDIRRFREIFEQAAAALAQDSASSIMDLSALFLAMRNIATCYSLATAAPDFTRDSPISLNAKSVPISSSTYRTLRQARMLATRGTGEYLTKTKISSAISEIPEMRKWIDQLEEELPNG